MGNEVWIAFMVGWAAAIGFMMIGGFVWWICLEWEKTKIKKLELEKIIFASKCKLKEMEQQKDKEMEQQKDKAIETVKKEKSSL